MATGVVVPFTNYNILFFVGEKTGKKQSTQGKPRESCLAWCGNPDIAALKYGTFWGKNASN